VGTFPHPLRVAPLPASAQSASRSRIPCADRLSVYLESVPDKDGFDELGEDAKRIGGNAWTFLVEHAREWLGAKLAIAAATVLAGAAATTFVLPFLLAFLCGVAAIGVVAYGVYGHRRAHKEKVLRRQAAISALRTRQRALRQEAAICEATLALAGKQNERGGRLGLRGFDELAAALRYAKAGRSGLVERESPYPLIAAICRPLLLPNHPTLRNLASASPSLILRTSLSRAQIQALAYPSKDLERDAKEVREKWHHARDADREARSRGRRGHRPWPEQPGMAFEVGTKPDGLPHARRLPPKATPEQIANGEQPNADAA
jgi:hypothetical protein